MKKILKTAYLIIFFMLFCLFELYTNSGTKVIKIITPVQIVVDLNNNDIVDDGEIVCIKNMQTFTSNLETDQNELIKMLNLSPEDALSLGYLTDELAKEELLYKKVKVKITGEKTPACNYGDIFIEDKNYGEELINSGLSIVNNKIGNSEVFKQRLEQAKNLNLVILNKKSGKYHTLNCKFGLKASDYLILPLSEAEQQYEKCKYCLVRPAQQKKLKEKDKKTLDQSTYPEVFNTEGIKFIVSDYTNHLTPHDKCTHSFCKETVDLINSTQSTLDMAIYDWNKVPEIMNALEKAKARNVIIRLIYDKRTGENYYPETEEFVQTFDNVRADEIDGSKNLTSMLMHNKFIVSDNKRVLTGSMNFSKTGLSGFNANNIVIINSPSLAQYYTDEFNQMFNGKFHTLKSAGANDNSFKIGNSNIRVYFSPQDKTAETALVPLINNAQKYIYLPVFVITHKNMTNALIKAKERGVDVKVILDATSTRSRNSTHTILRNAGIPLKTENYAGKVHNKSLIIDDKYVITGSMNFSNSGENKNDENCIIIENSDIAKFYRGYFEFLWKKIPDIYLKYSVRPESKYSIGSCYDGIDNDYDGKIDFNDEGCRR